MAHRGGVGDWFRDRLDESVPERDSLPRYVAPLPKRVEDLGLQLVWLVVAINLLGTAFGFYYYLGQFGLEPIVMWPFVPDSPVATLLIALSLAAWKLDWGRARSCEWLHALAFFGCLKLGFWTPYTLLVFREEFAYLHPAMYNFLFWSHLAMVVEAFVIHRYSDFPVWAVAVALAWYGVNDIVDYFVPIVGRPHHTLLPSEPIVDGAVVHVSPAHELAAAGAVVLTLLATVLALATRVKKVEGRSALSATNAPE